MFRDKELYDFLTDFNLEDPWEKVKELEGRIKYFSEIMPSGYGTGEVFYFFCLMDGEKIVGMLKLRVGENASLRYPDWKNWISFLSIDEGYRGRSCSKLLIEECMKFCKEENFDVLMSGYSKLGWERLRANFRKYADKYSVKMLDDKEQPEFD